MVEILDLLMTRYDMTYYNKMPLKLGVQLIYKAILERERAKAWQIWLTVYPLMTKQNFVPFSEYFTATMEDFKPQKHASTKEIISIAMQIEDKMQSGKFVEANL